MLCCCVALSVEIALTWNAHVAEVIERALSNMWCWNWHKLKWKMKNTMSKKMYKTFIESVTWVWWVGNICG